MWTSRGRTRLGERRKEERRERDNPEGHRRVGRRAQERLESGRNGRLWLLALNRRQLTSLVVYRRSHMDAARMPVSRGYNIISS